VVNIARKHPDKDTLRTLFDYRDGFLYRKYKKHTKIVDTKHGLYNRCSVIDGIFLVHRLVWIYFYGDIPAGMEIDHINNIKRDNRIENLRCVTKSKNQSNRVAKKSNVIEIKLRSGKIRYRAAVKHNGKSISKMFDLRDDGIEWAAIMKKEIWG
jgi:hypothetical protein